MTAKPVSPSPVEPTDAPTAPAAFEPIVGPSVEPVAEPVTERAAEPVTERAAEPAAESLTVHDRHVAAIATWLSDTSGEDLLVEVVTGPNRTQVARGRFVEMEAHPSAPGVHRLVFDNSAAGADAPSGQQWVAVGHELVDVAAGDTSLILDKGSQRIEVHVVNAGLAAPTAAPAAVAEPGVVAPTAAVQRPVEASSLLEAYAPRIEALATAPVYQNSGLGGSRLFGETKLEIVGDDLHVTARRMRHGTAFLVITGIVVGAFVLAGVLLYALQLFNARAAGVVADVDYLNATRDGTLAVAAAALVLYLAGRLLSAGREPETIAVPLVLTSGRKQGRVFVVRGPVGRKGRRRKLVLKPAGKAESARLAQLCAHLRG